MSTIKVNALRHTGGSSDNINLDSSARVLVGTSTARANFNNSTDTTPLQVEGTNAATSSFSLVCNSETNTVVSSVHLAKSDGTAIGSNGVVADNWNLGDIRFSGSDGTQFVAVSYTHLTLPTNREV